MGQQPYQIGRSSRTEPVIVDAALAESIEQTERIVYIRQPVAEMIPEANYSISSKQYVENGIHMKILSKGKPNENCVLDNDITLEDAYIYLTNS